MNNGLLVDTVFVSVFSPNLLHEQTLLLFMLCHMSTSFAPVIIISTIRGQNIDVKMGGNEMLAPYSCVSNVDGWY